MRSEDCYTCKHCEIVRGKPFCNSGSRPARLTEKQCANKRGCCTDFQSKSENKKMALLDALPVVDAVPVSFIRDLINLARKVGADSHAESLEVLLADWAETRQAPKTNISPCAGCGDYVYGGGCKRNGECVAR